MQGRLKIQSGSFKSPDEDHRAQLCTEAEDLLAFKGPPGVDTGRITALASVVRWTALLPTFSRLSPNLVCVRGGGGWGGGRAYETDYIQFRQVKEDAISHAPSCVIKCIPAITLTITKNAVG